ncbi:MAG: hypothetical protein F6J98_09890 [Moorea sp. SIO4G2]|nr:hypothetical protein [Moorena bouillonii]NEO60723.1 hypothetical protein [Moorena sp. SIO4G2]
MITLQNYKKFFGLFRLYCSLLPTPYSLLPTPFPNTLLTNQFFPTDK